MAKKKLLIYGVGRFAQYAQYVFNHDSQYSVEGFCMERKYLDKKKDSFTGNLEVVPFEDVENSFHPEEYQLFIAVGNNLIREKCYTEAKKKGYILASYISSKAVFWEDLKYGENCFIGEGSVLQPLTSLGNNCILFSTRIGHHSIIGDHTLLSSCLLGGNVQVGDLSFLGLHATIKENTSIGRKNIIGMGIVISNDTGPNEIYSAPAMKKRNITYDEFYRGLINS